MYADGALPRKVKFLIAMAFDGRPRRGGRGSGPAARAKKAGATDLEIAEALRVAGHLTGVGALYTASAGLREGE